MPLVRSFLFCIGITLAFTVTSEAQQALILVRKDRVAYRFNPGEHMRFQTRSRRKKSAVISGIYRDFMTTTRRDTVYFVNIRKIDVRKKPHQGMYVAHAGIKLITAGVAVLAVDATNAHDGDEISPSVLITSGALIGTGLLMQFVNNNYFKVNRRNRIFPK